MLEVRFTKRFEKDIKLIKKRKYDVEKLKNLVLMLREQKSLPEKFHDHPLTGNYSGYKECHIEPDWLLIYAIENNKLTLVLSRTGTHSDLY